MHYRSLMSLLLLCAACEPGPDAPGAATALHDTRQDTGAGDVHTPDAEPEAPPRFEPASATAFGYVPITVNLSGLSVRAHEVVGIRFGNANAIRLQVLDDDHVRVMVQGGPGGEVAVVVRTADDELTLPEPFVYVAPEHPAFQRIVAVGASLTQGVQRGTPSYHGGLFAPSAQLARRIGAYHPLPLLIDDLFPQLHPSEVGPAPACEVPSFLEAVETSADQILDPISDPDTGVPDYARARLDPELTVWNIGVGGSKLSDLIRGPPPGELGVTFLTHFVYEPNAAFLAPVAHTQLEMVQMLEPTMILVADIYGNDIISGVVSGDTLKPGRMTPLAELQADLAVALAGLAGTGAEVFFATLPRASMLPAAPARRQALIASGTPAAEVDALLQEIDQRSIDVNQTLIDLAADYDNVHVVDAFGFAEQLAIEGLPLSDRVLTPQRFGGLVSLDGVHFTDTGYAALANVFLTAINEALGTDVPPIDVEAVHRGDLESLESYLSMGFDPRECDQPPPIPR